MRTLCIDLHKTERSNIAENFLSFSSHIYFRSPHLVFLDITRSEKVFGGEHKLMDEALCVAREFYPAATAAITNSPATAQLFSAQFKNYVSQPLAELKELSELPLATLKQLEGLIPWQSHSEIEDIVEFFQILGLRYIGDVLKFDADAFRNRWGRTGAILWKRLHGHERQVIAKLIPQIGLTDHIHLDFPVSLAPYLFHCVQKSTSHLWRRLKTRKEYVKKVVLHLQCEHSGEHHVLLIKPQSLDIDLAQLLTHIEDQLFRLDLSNPIREYSLELVTHAKKHSSAAKPSSQEPIFSQWISGCSPKEESLPWDNDEDLTCLRPNGGRLFA